VSDIATIAELLRGAQRIVVLTGAGISTGSGIPDFRGPEGVWTKDTSAERRATIQHYVADAGHRKRTWRGRVDGDMWRGRGEPNAGHYALAELERRAALDTLVTQNVDGLHHLAGSSVKSSCPRQRARERPAVAISVRWRRPSMRVRRRGETLRASSAGACYPRVGHDLVRRTSLPDDLHRSQVGAANADLFLRSASRSSGVSGCRKLPELARSGTAPRSWYSRPKRLRTANADKPNARHSSTEVLPRI
jgi:hypothetical protein